MPQQQVTFSPNNNMATNSYYRLLAQTRAELAQGGESVRHGVHYITSLDLPERGITGDVTVSAQVEVAARCIASRTHRRAIPSEIDQFHSDQLDRASACFAETLRNSSNKVVTLTPSMARDLGFVPAEPIVEAGKKGR